MPHANVKNNNGQFENLCCYAYGFAVIICGRGESREKLCGVGKMGERETETVGNILGLKGERGKEGKSALVRRWGRERANPREESEIGTSSTTTGIAGRDFEEDVGKRKKNSSTAACFSETTHCFHYCAFHFRPSTPPLRRMFFYTVDIVVVVASVVYDKNFSLCSNQPPPLGLRCHAAFLYVSPLGGPPFFMLTHSLTHSLTHPESGAM